MKPRSTGPWLTRSAVLVLTILVPAAAFAGHELDDRDIPAGRSLYADRCAACHGANLEGQPDWRIANADGTLPAPPHDQTGHTWHHDNRLLFEYTRRGGQAALAARGITNFTSGMPAFEGVISEDEIWNILAYIRSTWPRRMQEVQASRNPPHP